MGPVKRLEKVFAEWNHSLPHLPNELRTWLVENMWWLALATVVVLVCGLFVLIPLFFTALALAPQVNVVTPYIPYYQTSLGLAWAGLAVFVFSFIFAAVLVAIAVNPLRDKLKKGWDTVFLAYLLFVLLNIAAAILLFNLWVFINVLADAVVGGYMLFEVRRDLVHRSVVSRKKA